MRKSDLDMVQLVEHMSNPVSKCIPECMYITLLVGADCSMISSEKNVSFYILTNVQPIQHQTEPNGKNDEVDKKTFIGS